MPALSRRVLNQRQGFIGDEQGFGVVAFEDPEGVGLLVADSGPGEAANYIGGDQHFLAVAEAFFDFISVAEVAPGLADFAPDQGFDLGVVLLLFFGAEDEAFAD